MKKNSFLTVIVLLLAICPQFAVAQSYELATMSIIKGKTGWIVVDPLTGVENATRAWEVFKQHVDAHPKVSAVIFTHSHVDHYKGVEAIVSADSIWEIAQQQSVQTSTLDYLYADFELFDLGWNIVEPL